MMTFLSGAYRFYPLTPGEPTRTTAPSCPHPDGVAPPAGSKGNKSRAWSRTSTTRSSTQVLTERLLLRVQGRVDARMAGRMAVLRGGDLNGPATHASGGADPSTTPSGSGFKRRARPRGSTGPRRPYGALE